MTDLDQRPDVHAAAQRHGVVMIGTHYDTMGGVSSVVNVYRRAGLFSQWNVTYVATHRDGTRWQKLGQLFKALYRYTALMVSKRPGLVHIHSSNDFSFWRKTVFFGIAKLFGVPVVFHIHAGRFEKFFKRQMRWPGQSAIRYVLEHADVCLALTPHWAQVIHGIAPKADVRVLPNPVEVPASYERHPQPGKIVALGRLSHDKGTYDLVNAFARIATKHPSASVHLAGDGRVEAIQSLCLEHHVGERVHVLGWLRGDAREELLRTAAVYVLPSYFEGLPMGILEAMARGIPVVSTRVGGIPDAVDDGRDGLLVNAGDVPALAAALDRILHDPGLAADIGTQGHRSACERFEASIVVSRLGDIYRDVLSRK